MTKNIPSDGSDDDRDYEIGYSKPPKHTRFKKGKSGNQKGRPKGAKSFSTDLREELSEKVPVRENGKVRILSKQRAILKAQVSKAMAGDIRAAQSVVSMVATYMNDDAETAFGTPLQAEDEKLIDDFLALLRLDPNGGGDDE
jgi:hypothetical protein